MRVNKLRSLLKSGGVALGTVILELKGRGLFHTLAAAGMDFAWICSEHTAFNLETVAEMVADAHAAGLTPIVRISDLRYEQVTRLLDSGCQSLIVPHIRTGAEVRRFIELAKYHPEGKRGIAIYGGANTNYENVEPMVATSHANTNTLLAVIIETAEALENLEEILLPKIDLVLIGHQDLSQDLGVPGQYDHPRVVAAEAKIREISRRHHIARGAILNQPQEVAGAVAAGAQFLLYGVDLMLVRREAQRATDALRPLLKH
jgi:2-dehydro-3-deoxyglucarate aldolase/4-hydroxy-2-oxoheptanedioate aldolase